MSGIWAYVAALIPSVGVGFLFWLVIKNMIEGDRKERLAHSQWDAQHPESRPAPAGPVLSENRSVAKTSGLPETQALSESRVVPETPPVPDNSKSNDK